MNESIHAWLQLPRFNSRLIRMEGAVELDIVAVNGVVGIVDDGVEVMRLAADLACRWISQVYWVAERSIVDGIIQAPDRLATQKVVERFSRISSTMCLILSFRFWTD